jgi:hypothetical protein
MAISTHITGYTVLASDWNQLVNALNAISLPVAPGAAIPPLSGLQSAGLDVVESSGAGTAKPIIYRLLFDTNTAEGRMWIFRVPDTFVSSPVLNILYYSTGANVSKTYAPNVQVACVSNGDANMTSKVFATTNQTVVTVPDAAGTLAAASVTITNADSMAAGDWCCLCLWRDVSNDNAANDIAVVGLVLTYSLA